MSKEQLERVSEYTENLLSLHRAPSQFRIFFQLLSTGRTMTVKEMAEENKLTEKATERATAKLLDRGLVERSMFREGGYTVNIRRVMISMYMTILELYSDYRERES
ncbi:MAG: hypothetical protein ACLFVP_05650 [Candidatus Bathyarchaeia archaeon]